MIYKRIPVRAAIIKAGQVVGAPIASFPLKYAAGADGGTWYEKGSLPMLHYVGVRQGYHQGEDIAKLPDIYEMVSSPMGFDVSETVFIELKGEFHSTPLILQEGVIASGHETWINLSPDEVRSAQITNQDSDGATMGSSISQQINHRAYVLLTDVMFTGEVLCHNTIDDRTRPFLWPIVCSEYSTNSLPSFTVRPTGDVYGGSKATPAQQAVDAYLAVWQRRPKSDVITIANDSVQISNIHERPDLDRYFEFWRTMYADPAATLPFVSVLQQGWNHKYDVTARLAFSASPNAFVDARLTPIPSSSLLSMIAAAQMCGLTRGGAVNWDSGAGITLEFEFDGRGNTKFVVPLSMDIINHHSDWFRNNYTVDGRVGNPLLLVGPFAPSAVDALDELGFHVLATVEGSSFPGSTGTLAADTYRFIQISATDLLRGSLYKAQLAPMDMGTHIGGRHTSQPSFWFMSQAHWYDSGKAPG